MNPITGGCLCGSVRYRATGIPTRPTLCHCMTCRRASGAHALGWLTFATRDFQFTANLPAQFRSSPAVLRSFCSNCGTPLTYARDDSPQRIDVTLGSLDAPESIPPADHTWMCDAVAWDRPRDDLPQYPTAGIE
jgi:hypothetical protein